MKRCTRCSSHGPFAKDKHKRDGLRSQCKACQRIYDRKTQSRHNELQRINRRADWDAYLAGVQTYRRHNRERLKTKRLADYALNAEKYRSKSREWSRRHRDLCNARKRAYRAAHPKAHVNEVMAWRVANIQAYREWARMYQHRRRARKSVTTAALTKREWLAILEYFDGACAYCLRRVQRLTVDHMIAIARGGEHVMDNVVPACLSCNSKKNDAPIFVMARHAHA
jgi:hypothetical protein